jgi:hypothetical protein
VLLQWLQLYAYRIKLVQLIKPDDNPRYVECASLILICIDDEWNILNTIIFSGGATFLASGHGNSHNCRIWVVENSCMVQELICVILKPNVWCRLMCDHVFGPFIFVENTLNPSALTSVHCTDPCRVSSQGRCRWNGERYSSFLFTSALIKVLSFDWYKSYLFWTCFSMVYLSYFLVK